MLLVITPKRRILLKQVYDLRYFLSNNEVLRWYETEITYSPLSLSY